MASVHKLHLILQAVWQFRTLERLQWSLNATVIEFVSLTS